MAKQYYEDYKYVMMDTAFLYLGAKYSYGEIFENDEVPFKFRTIVERYIVPEIGVESLFFTADENHTVGRSDSGQITSVFRPKRHVGRVFGEFFQ